MMLLWVFSIYVWLYMKSERFRCKAGREKCRVVQWQKLNYSFYREKMKGCCRGLLMNMMMCKKRKLEVNIGKSKVMVMKE